MNVSVGPRWEEFLDRAVKSGRYASVSEVVREGLRLVEEREARLADLRRLIAASIAEGGASDEAQLDEALAAKRRELTAKTG